MDFMHQVERVRPNDAANQQIAENRRQVEAAEYDHGEDRGAKEQKDEGECAQGRYLKSGILRPS
jgi:hypothetical protein